MAIMLKNALLGIAVAAALPLTAIAGNAGTQYSVELNKTELLNLPGAASAVIIGNPDIADVSVHSANTLFVVGRGYGQTNLLVLDSMGQKMLDANIQVTQSSSLHGVRLFNASERQTYSCAPYCTAAPTLGDAKTFKEEHETDNEPISSNTSAGSIPSLPPAAQFQQNAHNAETSPER